MSAKTGEVQHPGKVQPAFGCLDVGNVSHPDLIGTAWLGHLRQTVGCDWMVMVAVGCAHAVSPPLAAAYPLLSHQPGDPVAPMPLALSNQAGLDARRTIGLPAFKVDPHDVGLEILVAFRPLGRVVLSSFPVLIAAGADVKALAQKADGMLCFHRVDPLIPLPGLSERMPNVFFKTSRC